MSKELLSVALGSFYPRWDDDTCLKTAMFLAASLLHLKKHDAMVFFQVSHPRWFKAESFPIPTERLTQSKLNPRLNIFCH